MFTRKEMFQEDRLYSPLEIACLREHSTVVDLLVRAGCDQCSTRLATAGLQTDSSSLFRGNVVPHRVPSLAILCRRPTLELLLPVAQRRRLPLADVIARLPVDDDIRRLLGFNELDEPNGAGGRGPIHGSGPSTKATSGNNRTPWLNVGRKVVRDRTASKTHLHQIDYDFVFVPRDKFDNEKTIVCATVNR